MDSCNLIWFPWCAKHGDMKPIYFSSDMKEGGSRFLRDGKDSFLSFFGVYLRYNVCCICFLNSLVVGS